MKSPYDLESRRFSSPILGLNENKEDLSSTVSSSHLRRHSYLNAVNDDEATTPRRFTENKAALEKKFRNMKLGRNGSDAESYESFSSGESARSPTNPNHSRHLSDASGKISRQRPWSLAIDAPSRTFQTSPKLSRPKTPPVITDRSRTLQASPGSPRTQRKASPLAIIDSITRGPTERDSDHGSPTSSPIPRRRTPQPSPKHLRVQSEPQSSLKNITRTPSATSSSSSGSSGSWRDSSFGSGSTDRGRKRHILPSTPDRHTPRRDSK